MINVGDKFIITEDSSGGSYLFWADTLSVRIEGSFVKGDVVEVKEYQKDRKGRKISMIVDRIDRNKLDIEITDSIVPVSVVGLYRKCEPEFPKEVVDYLQDIRSDNLILLLMTKVPYSKKSLLRCSLKGTDNSLLLSYNS